MSILLVEDERINRMAMKQLMRKAGHRVVTAEDGSQAIKALRANPIDLVLMDVQMPIMDGLTASKEIRAGAAGPEKRGIPIIALTAYAMDGDREKFLAAGMNDYLAKPVALDDLLAMAGKVLGSMA